MCKCLVSIGSNLIWLTEVITGNVSDESVEWSGYMAKSAREQLQPKPTTNYVFGLWTSITFNKHVTNVHAFNSVSIYD